MGTVIWEVFIGVGALLNVISLAWHTWYFRTYGISRPSIGRVGGSVITDVLIIAGLTVVMVTAATDHNLLLVLLAGVGLITGIADTIVVLNYTKAIDRWRT